MSEHDSDPRSPSGNGSSGWVIAVIAIPIFYILSPGPLVAVYGRSIMAPSWALVYVAPLEWCCERFPPMQKFYDKYLDLWLPR